MKNKNIGYSEIFTFIIMCCLLFFISGCFGSSEGGGGSSSTGTTNTTTPSSVSSSSSGNNSGASVSAEKIPDPPGAFIVITKADKSAVAVLAGLNNYPDPYDLYWCANDATDLRDAFIGSNFWSGASVNITTSNITKDMIKNAINQASASIADDGTFVFLFSGHGTSNGYLVPYDGATSNGADVSKCISDTDLKSWLSSFKSTVKKVVYIDSCYSGFFIGKYLDEYSPVINLKYMPLDKSTNDEYKGEFAKDITAGINNIVCITASKSNEVAQESPALQNSVFSYYLIEGLGASNTIGPADADASLSISAEETHAYTAPKSTLFYSGQHPQIQDNFTGELIIKN